jgi:uncharacterized protein YdeI (YjbR/CyaY-like superfamily)
VKPENIRFFATQADFRDWLAENHDTQAAQWVGFYKKASGKTAMTYDEAVEEALCWGWIDGQTNRLDDDAVTTRFSPRTARSNWSAVNIAKVEALNKEGRMKPSGLAAFEQRRDPEPGQYTYETRPPDLPVEYAATFRRNEKAWNFYSAQRPGYRKSMTWWVVSAKREDTRLRRLEALMAESEAEHVIDDLPKLSPRPAGG